MIRIVLFFWLTGITAVQASPEKIQVLSTIKPIHLIVNAIAGDKAELAQLIPDYASVHDYSFKPSDIRKIKNTALVFRIDEHLESILTSVLENNVPLNRLISLAEQDGIDLLALRSDGHQHGSDNGEHEDGDEVSHKDSHKGKDLHIWTSPKNAIVMANVIALSLAKVDPDNSQTYQNNLLLFKASVQEASQEIKLQLSTVRHKSYVVFHDSLHYFSDYFELQEPEILSFHDALGGNIKSIMDTRRKIKADGIACIISDPSIHPDRVDTIRENMQIKAVQIDGLASDVTIDPQSNNFSYTHWLSAVANKINNCLRD